MIKTEFSHHSSGHRTRNLQFRACFHYGLIALLVMSIFGGVFATEAAAARDPRAGQVVTQGLDWLANQQSRLGHWSAANGRYPTAMTAMAGMTLLAEGSTTTQGKYSENIRHAVRYLLSRSRPNGLIGNPLRDDRYTYGHGFSMLFLSQVLGEEEDKDRRKELVEVLTRAVIFSGEAQTEPGGWGYVSAKDRPGFDEGSTTITQVQGLRGCRNAGIPVPKEIIDKAVKYIKNCTRADGGVQYNTRGGGGRPAITAAAIACLYNAGEYDSEYVPKLMEFCKKRLDTGAQNSFGHWHYAHYYYSQVKYREGEKTWQTYRDKIIAKLLAEARNVKSGDKTLTYWNEGYLGPVYVTSINLTILQLDQAALPIYQR